MPGQARQADRESRSALVVPRIARTRRVYAPVVVREPAAPGGCRAVAHCCRSAITLRGLMYTPGT